MALKQKRTFSRQASAAAAGLMTGFTGVAAGQTAFASAGQAQSAPGSETQSSDEVRATLLHARMRTSTTRWPHRGAQYEQTSRSEYATQAIEY